MKIEKYELTKKNIYNVYLSNGEVLELNGKVITDNELLIKKDIDNELYDKLKRDNTICILVDTSVKYIDRRLRSINELRDYLKNKEEDTIIIEEVIDKLIDYKYLDDDRFTKAFIKDKLNFTNWGDYKIKNDTLIFEYKNVGGICKCECWYRYKLRIRDIKDKFTSYKLIQK